MRRPAVAAFLFGILAALLGHVVLPYADFPAGAHSSFPIVSSTASTRAPMAFSALRRADAASTTTPSVPSVGRRASGPRRDWPRSGRLVAVGGSVAVLAGFLAAEDVQFGSYSDLRKVTAGQGGDIQAHHLIEKRFQNVMGGDPDTWDSVVLSRTEHQAFTNAWRREIGYGKGTREATPADVIAAAHRIYTNPAFWKRLGLD